MTRPALLRAATGSPDLHSFTFQGAGRLRQRLGAAGVPRPLEQYRQLRQSLTYASSSKPDPAAASAASAAIEDAGSGWVSAEKNAMLGSNARTMALTLHLRKFSEYRC